MITIEFTPTKGLTESEIYDTLQKLGVFHCEDYNHDDIRYEMSDTIGLDDLPESSREELISYYKEEYNLDFSNEETVEDYDLVVREGKTVLFDMKNNQFSYSEGDFYGYALNNGLGETVYLEHPEDHKTEFFTQLEDQLRQIGWIQ